jgi:hypothetical protein
MIIAHTVKGKGINFIEGASNSHALASFSSEEAENVVRDLTGRE